MFRTSQMDIGNVMCKSYSKKFLKACKKKTVVASFFK